VTYSAFNGLYDNNLQIGTGAMDRLEIDLGGLYDIVNIIVYNTATPNPQVETYGQTGNMYRIENNVIYSRNRPTDLTRRYIGYGNRARYVGIRTLANNAFLFNLVAVDALGRNVAAGKKMIRSGLTGTSPSMPHEYSNSEISIGETRYVEFDLVEEHNIAYLVVFPKYGDAAAISTTSANNFNTTLTGATITLMDAYRILVATRTIVGTGASASVSYDIGAEQTAGTNNCFTKDAKRYLLPDKPFVGPFSATGDPGAPNITNNIVNNKFVGASYAEVIDFIQPPPITGLFIHDVLTSSIVIKWNGGGSEKNIYTINGIITAPSSESIANKTATFSNLTTSANKYVFGVTGLNAAGSIPPAFTTYSPKPIDPVLAVTVITSTSVTISWTRGDGAMRYLYTIDNIITTPANDNGLLGKMASFANLTGNTRYGINVYAINSTNSTGSSNLFITTAPVNPTGLSYSNNVLSWSGGDGAISYKIMRNEVDVTNLVTINVPANKATFTDLVGNTTYSCIVTAINSEGLESDSALFTFLTAPVAPNLLLAGLTATSLSISWTGGDGASNYRFSQIM